MSADQTPPPPQLSYANPQGATAPSNGTSQYEEKDSTLGKKDHGDDAFPPVHAAGRGISLLAEAEEGRREGGRTSKRLLLSRPAEMNPDQGPDKHLQKQQDGSTVPGLNPPALPTIEEGVQLPAIEEGGQGAMGPTPRMLRIFIIASITWSAAITSCLGPYFPLVRSKGRGRKGRREEKERRDMNEKGEQCSCACMYVCGFDLRAAAPIRGG